MRFCFRKLVQLFELKRVGGAPKGRNLHPYKPSKILYMEVTDYLLWKADDLISSQPRLTQQCSLTSSMTCSCNVHYPVFHSTEGTIDWYIIQVCSIMKKKRNQAMACRLKELLHLHVNTILLYCYLLTKKPLLDRISQLPVNIWWPAPYSARSPWRWHSTQLRCGM